jgi:hypothetical protein
LARLVPTPAQGAAIDRIVCESTRSTLVGSALGSGKSLVATESIKRLDLPVNVVTAPLHTRDGWERHFQLQGLDDLRFANNKSKAGRSALSDLRFGIPGNYFMGREYARLLDWSDMRVGAYVSDESHSWCSPKSRGFKAHMKMRAEFKIAQSATWFGASFESAWSPARFLWPERSAAYDIADISRYRWLDTYCATEYDAFAQNHKRVIGEKNPGEFVSKLPCYIRLESDLPELQPIPIYYDLSPRQRKLYDQMEKDSVAWLRGNPLVAELPLTQRIRLRELTLAEAVLDDEGSVQFPDDAHSSLLDTVREMLGDLMGEQILMGTHSAKFARFVASKLDSTYGWTGQESETLRAEAKARFVSGTLRNIVATQASIGEGTDSLQLASHVMFELSQADSPIINQQFRGRLHRRGQTKPVICYQLRGRGTLDDPQAETLLQKELRMRASLATL